MKKNMRLIVQIRDLRQNIGYRSPQTLWMQKETCLAFEMGETKAQRLEKKGK